MNLPSALIHESAATLFTPAILLGSCAASALISVSAPLAPTENDETVPAPLPTKAVLPSGVIDSQHGAPSPATTEPISDRVPSPLKVYDASALSAVSLSR